MDIIFMLQAQEHAALIFLMVNVIFLYFSVRTKMIKIVEFYRILHCCLWLNIFRVVRCKVKILKSHKKEQNLDFLSLMCRFEIRFF